MEDNAKQKLKKDGSGEPPALKLTENPDILKSVGHLKNHRPALVVGFAAETENVVANARRKLTVKNADIIIANDVSDEGGVMGGRDNTVHLVGPDNVEDWEKMPKQDVATRLMNRFSDMLAKIS
jgi:phosphopantothenoylcysteine decarboxylase/phosphopantothenate--cysteine ligase